MLMRHISGSLICVLSIALFQGGTHNSAKTKVSNAPFNLRLVATDKFGGGDGAISPDGRFFVISSKRSGNWELWIHDLQTAQWERVTDDPADDFEAQWSPDGRRLAYTSTKSGNKDILVLSLGDRKINRLTDSPEDDEYPAWSPDGRTIVYTGGAWKERDFFLVPAEGGTPRRLSRKSGQAGACSFAPDGQSVICHRYDSGTGNVERISLITGDSVAVTSGREWDYKPTISPDGKWMACSRANENRSVIWLSPLNGGTARALVVTGNDDRWPTWTAAGDRLFFHRAVDEGEAIKILNLETGRVRTVAGAEEKPRQASFDPEGRRIVYAAQTGMKQELHIRDLAKGTVERLPTGEGEAAFPRWSPDGKKIAFVSRTNERWEVQTINVDGTELMNWTQSAKTLKGMYGPVDWSPDSQRIVFKADTAPFEANLYIVDTKTGKIRDLTNDKWFNESPSWTADGDGIIFMSTRGGNWTWGLYRISVKDGSISTIAVPDYTEKNFPRMSTGGRIVWSEYGEDGLERVREARSAGKRKRLLETTTGGRWPAYSASGRLLLFTTLSRRVEYWLAENLYSSDSPLFKKTNDNAERATTENKPSATCKSSSALTVSPIKLHSR